MIKWLMKFYSNEMFNPSLLGILINPYYIIRKGLHNGIAANSKSLNGKLLDLGCGKKPYKVLFDVDEYIGIDIGVSGHDHKNSQVDVYYDGNNIPFEDQYFDSVFSSEVFEHVFNLEVVIKELNRVLKHRGYMLITLPFVWDEHEIPYDFARYTSFGIKHLLEKGGFEVINIIKTTNYVDTIFQMWNAYVCQTILRSSPYLKLFFTPIIIAPVTILGILLSIILPTNDGFYNNNIVLCRRK